MRCLLLTLGTHGDFEQFRLLGRELVGRGHEVTITASSFYRERAEATRLGFLPIGTGTQQELQALFRSLAGVADQRARVRTYAERWARPQLAQSMHEVRGALARTDYFINNLRSVWRIKERIIPGAAITYDPVGDVENLRKYAAQLAGYERAILEVVALPKALVDADGQWGPRFHFTGFWPDEEARERRPSAELQGFVEEGPPPVAVTMGSMATFDPVAFKGTVGAALRLAGRRGVLIGGWSDVYAAPTASPELFLAAEAPYEWLFPRCALVVHHGGAGTVAATLRAGRPSIVLPQISSQQHFATLLRRHGVLVDAFDLHDWTAEALAQAIARGYSETSYMSAAQGWRERLANDQGLSRAAELIEAHAREM